MPSESVLDLMRAAAEENIETEYIRIQGLDSYITDNKIRVLYHDRELGIDAAIVRGVGMFMTLEVFAKRVGVLEALARIMPVVNNPAASVIARDKWRSLLALASAGLPVPDTMVTENPFTAMRFTKRVGKSVVKPIMGSLGLGSTIVGDPDLAFQVTKGLTSMGIPSYYQVFLDKPGFDLRIFVVGDSVVAAMKRVIEVGWKTNIAQGAVGVRVSESEYPEAFEAAVKAVKVLGLDYGGVDIAYDKGSGRFFILEVNAFPQWHGLKQATGVDPSKFIIRLVRDKVRK
ncbi:ATP-grasp domain-containing protein [Thermogladius sp. 4427co]|uniref:ATP-grasp domain-containing protein n=1 Tax=Thermogladius sp. 4427co TaxID=3450718 RepID=UPI003F7AED86